MKITEALDIPSPCLNCLHITDLIEEEKGLELEVEHAFVTTTDPGLLNYMVEHRSAVNEQQGLEPVTEQDYRQEADEVLARCHLIQERLAQKAQVLVENCDGKGPLVLRASRGDRGIEIKVCGSDYFKKGENVELVEVKRFDIN